LRKRAAKNISISGDGGIHQDISVPRSAFYNPDD
jgi:hypothetical protein